MLTLDFSTSVCYNARSEVDYNNFLNLWLGTPMDGFHCVVCGQKLTDNHKCPAWINSRDSLMKNEFTKGKQSEAQRLNDGLKLMYNSEFNSY